MGGDAAIRRSATLPSTQNEMGTMAHLMEGQRDSEPYSTSRQGNGLATSRFACLRCCGKLISYLVRLRNTPEELEQRYKSREIDKFLEKEKHTFRRQVNNALKCSVPTKVYVYKLIQIHVYMLIGQLYRHQYKYCTKHIYINIYFR